MIAHQGLRSQDGVPPIRYAALQSALDALVRYLDFLGGKYKVQIHGPRIGCGLAGGKWEQISAILETALCSKGYSVSIYDL